MANMKRKPQKLIPPFYNIIIVSHDDDDNDDEEIRARLRSVAVLLLWLLLVVMTLTVGRQCGVRVREQIMATHSPFPQNYSMRTDNLCHMEFNTTTLLQFIFEIVLRNSLLPRSQKLENHAMIGGTTNGGRKRSKERRIFLTVFGLFIFVGREFSFLLQHSRNNVPYKH